MILRFIFMSAQKINLSPLYLWLFLLFFLVRKFWIEDRLAFARS